jgi:uncharacterized membrane protein YhhN
MRVYFIAGLVAFVLSHIAYILLFNTQIKPKKGKNKAVFWMGVTAIMCTNRDNCPIVASLGDLTIPVLFMHW